MPKPEPPIFKVVTFGGYPFDVLVCAGANAKQVIGRLKRLGHTVAASDAETFSVHSPTLASTVHLPATGHTIIMLPKRPKTSRDWAMVTHEVFHAVCFVLRCVGVEPGQATEEAYAYALQDLMQKVIGALSKG